MSSLLLVPAFRRATAIGPLKTALYVGNITMSGDYDRQRDAMATMRAVAALPDVLKFKKIISAIDDAMDSMHPGALLDLGKAFPSATDVSPLLRNENLFPQSYLQTLREFDRLRVLPYSLGLAYSNLLAIMSLQKAELEETYQKTRDPVTRAAASSLNVDICEVYGSFFMAMITHNRPSPDNLNIETIRAIQPHTCQISRAEQLMDDYEDLLVDLDLEARLGVVPSNAILSHAFTAGANRMQLNEYYMTLKCGGGNVPRAALPAWLAASVNAVEQRFYGQTAQINQPLVREVIAGYWQRVNETGMKPVPSPVKACMSGTLAHRLL